jgi:hypothetical protein
MSASLISYVPNARISVTLSAFNPSQANWGLGVNYENTFRNVISVTLSAFNPSQANWGLGVNYENTFRNVSDFIR